MVSYIKIGRTQKDVIIQDGKALFEVPVNLFLQNEDQYDYEDTMIILCEINLSDNSLSIKGKLGEKGEFYEGELDEWYEDATQFLKSHFSGKPKTREDLDMDRYLRS